MSIIAYLLYNDGGLAWIKKLLSFPQFLKNLLSLVISISFDILIK